MILYYCLTEKDAFDIEISIVNEWFVAKYNTYNIMVGGKGGNIDRFLTDKQKESKSYKISIRNKGSKKNLSEKQRLRFSENTKIQNIKFKTGVPLSEVHKEKISNANKGKPKSDEHKLFQKRNMSFRKHFCNVDGKHIFVREDDPILLSGIWIKGCKIK